jgi:putative ABC transport system permease protein
MSTTRLVTLSFRAMARYKLRSGFMMLGSLVGVAVLTLVVSIGQGIETKILKTVGQILGDSSVVIVGGGSRLMGGHRPEAARLTLDDIATIAKEIPEIEAWDPQQDLLLSVKHADRTTTVRVLGESERAEHVWGRTVSRGAFFDLAAVTGSARVAVIGWTVARALFGIDDPLDAEIRIGAVPFRVIGVLEPFGTDMHGMDRDNEIVVPISTLTRRLTNVDTISAARLLLRDPSVGEDAGREVTRILRERHVLTAGQPDDFRILTALEVRRNVAMIQRILFWYVPLVAAVALVVGGIVSAMLMLASVNARISEIGLRRAVGARPEDIRLQFLIETAVTTISGGLGGIALGYIGAQVVATRLELGDIFSWKAVLLGVTAAAVTGLIAGVAPARRAARLQPADALR